MLRERLFGDVNKKQAEYLDDILTSAHHLLALINDILDLSKVEAGQVELEVAPFSLREALERGLVMVRERATRDGVEVALTALPDADVVTGDERRIRQVIFNLLSNAVKFTPAGGAVDVVRRAPTARCGSRSPTPVLASPRRITNASSRSSSRPRRASSNAREPASASPSRSGWSSCTAAGSGSTASSATGAPSCSRCPRGVHSDGRRGILVVEDNEKNMKLFRDVLEASGYRTMEATTGAQAVELATEHGPALVLMDIQLPDIDGVEALGRLRADARTASIPVFALTAQAMEGDRERFLAAGFDGYVSKPVESSSSRATVQQEPPTETGDERRRRSQDPRGGRRPRERAPARGRARAPRLRRDLGLLMALQNLELASVREAGPCAARRRDAADGRLRRLPPALRHPRGDRRAAGDHAHGECRPLQGRRGSRPVRTTSLQSRSTTTSCSRESGRCSGSDATTTRSTS